MSHYLLDKRLITLGLKSLNQPIELMTNEGCKRLKASNEIIDVRKTIRDIVDNMINTVVSAESTRTPKQIEEQRIRFICDSINNRTGLGTQMRNKYMELFGKEISNVVTMGGGLKDHYDFVINHTDNTSKRCEEKGTDTYYEYISNFKIPWENSVQRYNGSGDKFSIGRKYAKLWWEKVVNDKTIKSDYNLDCEIPTEEEWLSMDAFKNGDPTSPYGVLLKKKFRERFPGRTSMNGKKGVPYDYRKNVNPLFTFTEEDEAVLIKELQAILDEIMDEKECWLQTTGTITGPFNFKWYDKIPSPKIEKITMSWKEGADIYFHCSTENPQRNFKCILRFGKGTGFSNIRLDIR